MLDQGWLARLEVRPGRDHDFETSLGDWRAGRVAAASFALRFGRSAYGILEIAGGGADAALPAERELLDGAPRVAQFTVLARKPPEGDTSSLTRGLLLTLAANPGQAAALEDLLVGAQAWVEEERDTAAWFALRFANGDYGLFAAFAGDAARFAHLAGAVPRALTKHALPLLAGVPDMHLLQLLAAR
jgi:hypothetical protein